MILEMTLFTLVWGLMLGLVVMYLKWHWENGYNRDFEDELRKRYAEWEEREEKYKAALDAANESIESLISSFDNIEEAAIKLHEDYENAVAENIDFREGGELSLAKYYRGAIFLDKDGGHSTYSNGELVVDEQVTFFQYVKGKEPQFYVTYLDSHNVDPNQIQEEY